MSASKIRIVRDPGPGRPFTITRITCVEPLAALRSCGFDARPHTQLVVRGEPKLLPAIRGFVGPILEDDVVRYEDAAVAALLSR